MAGVDHATGAASEDAASAMATQRTGGMKQLSLQMLLATYEHHASPKGTDLQGQGAGYRSAEDSCFGQGSRKAYGGPCSPTADGGTAGACADDHLVLFFAADCRARPLTFQFLGEKKSRGRWKRGLQRFSPWTGLSSSGLGAESLIFQFLRTSSEGNWWSSKVLSQDRVQQQYLEQIAKFSKHVKGPPGFLPGQSSSSSKAVCLSMKENERNSRGFSHFFPFRKK